MIEKIRQARAYAAYVMVTKGAKSKVVEIEEIPKKLEFFNGTKDQWVAFELPESEDCSCALYKGQKGSVFKGHYHKVAESFFIKNKTGRVKVYTKKRTVVLEFPNGIHFDPEEEHYCKFESYTDLLIVWTPKMKGWVGKFVKGVK